MYTYIYIYIYIYIPRFADIWSSAIRGQLTDGQGYAT